MEIRGEGPRFAFLPPEEPPGALFDLGVGKAEVEEELRDLGAHDDLFESISEAHYLPELGGHDEALLESLVEKGCEDNQILGRLDRLSALASGAEYEEAELLDAAPVHDLIGRLDALESPSRSAAQGLLHLHHLPQRRAAALDAFAQEDLFAPAATPPPPRPAAPAEDAPCDGEDRAQVMYSEQVSDLPDGFDYEDYEDIAPSAVAHSKSTPVRTDATSTEDVAFVEISQSTEAAAPENKISQSTEAAAPQNKIDDEDSDENDLILVGDYKAPPNEREEILKATDLSKTSVFAINDEPPQDLSIHGRIPSYASPRRIDIPRAPSRESDAMQSPQPSGIPAMSSPEVFTNPTSKTKHPPFLECLYAGSTSPKMFTSEVTIQQCGPTKLGKNRKSASPTVSSCSDEPRNLHKDAGEPQEKRVRRESHDLAKICNLLKKSGEMKLAEAKQKKKQNETEQLSALKQLDLLISNKNFNLPEHLLVPRDRVVKIVTAPGKEIPALLMEKPQLNLSEILQDPNFIEDPELIVISLEQIRQIIIHESTEKSKKTSDTDHTNHTKDSTKEIEKETVSEKSKSKSSTRSSEQNKPSSSERTPSRNTPQPSSTAAEQSSASSQPRGNPPLGHLADDIEAATTAAAAAYHQNWLPAYMAHMSQLEAMAACSQNPEFLKAFGSSGAYANANYANLSQMFHPSRMMNFPMIPGMADYESRAAAQMALYQEMTAQALRLKHAAAERPSSGGRTDPRKEAPTPLSPYAHLAKSQPATSKHSSRASPLAAAAAYTSAQQRAAHAHFMSMYPSYEMRAHAQDIQIPYYTPPGSQRSPRASHSKSPTSPYFPNNNYLHSSKEPARGASGERGRPRISVKSMQELQKTNSMACHGAGAPPLPPPLLPASLPRRQEPEVGSTTSAGEPPPPHLQHIPQMPLPPHPHDPTASGTAFWHPLFSNQKGYASPWSWTTVTATGD